MSGEWREHKSKILPGAVAQALRAQSKDADDFARLVAKYWAANPGLPGAGGHGEMKIKYRVYFKGEE